MPNTLRFLALLSALLFLPICWIWAYYIALAGYLFGAIAWWMLGYARRLEQAMGVVPTLGWLRLESLVRGLVLLCVVLSLVSLVAFQL